MEIELQKIEAYFDEIGRTWEKNPELVLTRQFFELWEESQKPMPFHIAPGELKLLDQVIPITEKRTVVLLEWSFDEEAPILSIETPHSRTEYPVFVTDGVAEFGESRTIEFDDRSVSFGERFEVILDIISFFREKHPSRNVLDIAKSEYTDAIHVISDRHDPQAIKIMSRIKLPEVRKLVEKAVQDMALDELSDQLVLPLDGSYAANAQQEVASLFNDGPFAVHPSKPRTRHAIWRDLRFLCEAGNTLAQLEQGIAVSFGNCEVLSGKNPVMVRVKVPSELPLRKGETLIVYSKAEMKTPIARFRVEINDRTALIGQVRWPDVPEALTAVHFAAPQRSPAKYMAQLMEAFAGEFDRENRFDSAALNAILGVDDFTFEDTPAPREQGKLDPSQRRAWANAVNPNNPIALIQGPPGTGKTHVLVSILRDLVERGKRVLVAAPSHTAVDNVCRRVFDLPVLRIGRDRDKVAPDVVRECWIGELTSVHKFQTKRREGAAVYAGTHVGLLRDDIVLADLDKNGLFDAVIFDEAGMARIDEFLICTKFAHRAILVGDHQQLPPFPLPDDVLKGVQNNQGVLRSQEAMIVESPMQWLVEQRNMPMFVLQSSYRCQNPRLMRFSSNMFYNAQVTASALADYYQLPYPERQKRYPSTTLRFYTTSNLPLNERVEQLKLEEGQPGFENALEAKVALTLLDELLSRFPLNEITIIVPYRRQVSLIREYANLERAVKAVGKDIPEQEWHDFLASRISTVDSFQGGESDVVIISYVRSNAAGGIGFVDDPNRINVAHTRCRREMYVIGDLECLKKQGRNRIFQRMARGIERDGEIVEVTADMVVEPPRKQEPETEEDSGADGESE